MKKFTVLAVAVMLVFGVAGVASALNYYEAYTGAQYVNELGPDYSFGFDFWYPNVFVGTNSNLALTADASGMNGDNNVEWWTAATLEIDFFDTDWLAWEEASITLTAYSGGGSFDLGTFAFNANWWSGDEAHFIHDFTPDQLAAFDIDDWGQVVIGATFGLDWNYNDFSITKVAMNVTTEVVPEPGTVLLVGSGILGLLALKRKRR